MSSPFSLVVEPVVVGGERGAWTLHLRAARDVDVLWRAVLATGCEALTGEAVGGDCWLEWCECACSRRCPTRALHVYLHASDLAAAQRTAEGLLDALSRFGYADRARRHAVLSAAGDWSEQYPLTASAVSA